MKSLFVMFFALLNFVTEGQTLRPIEVSFMPLFNNTALELDVSLNEDNLKISKLRFYVTNISFFNGDNLLWKESDSYHLLDVEDEGSMNLILDVPDNIDANQLMFDLGVDSLTNVSGAMAGDLDPMHGMYWAWQSGYINFKIEGRSDKCPARKNKFQYHLGGFLAPNISLQKVSLTINKINDINVSIDISKLFETIDVSKTYEIMSPRPEAVSISQQVASIFEIKE